MNQIQFSKETIVSFLKECLAKPAKRAEFELTLKDGHTAFSYRVYTTVTANECKRAYFPPGTPVDPAEEKKRGKITKKKMNSKGMEVFLKGLLDNELWNLENCKQSGMPDEGDLRFILAQKGTLIFDKVVWESCKNSDARTAALLKLIKDVSPPS